jgi:hypothetical protein
MFLRNDFHKQSQGAPSAPQGTDRALPPKQKSTCGHQKKAQMLFLLTYRLYTYILL